jgi:hypothetical protein
MGCKTLLSRRAWLAGSVRKSPRNVTQRSLRQGFKAHLQTATGHYLLQPPTLLVRCSQNNGPSELRRTGTLAPARAMYRSFRFGCWLLPCQRARPAWCTPAEPPKARSRRSTSARVAGRHGRTSGHVSIRGADHLLHLLADISPPLDLRRCLSRTRDGKVTAHVCSVPRLFLARLLLHVLQLSSIDSSMTGTPRLIGMHAVATAPVRRPRRHHMHI